MARPPLPPMILNAIIHDKNPLSLSRLLELSDADLSTVLEAKKHQSKQLLAAVEALLAENPDGSAAALEDGANALEGLQKQIKQLKDERRFRSRQASGSSSLASDVQQLAPAPLKPNEVPAASTVPTDTVVQSSHAAGAPHTPAVEQAGLPPATRVCPGINRGRCFAPRPLTNADFQQVIIGGFFKCCTFCRQQRALVRKNRQSAKGAELGLANENGAESRTSSPAVADLKRDEHSVAGPGPSTLAHASQSRAPSPPPPSTAITDAPAADTDLVPVCKGYTGFAGSCRARQAGVTLTRADFLNAKGRLLVACRMCRAAQSARSREKAAGVAKEKGLAGSSSGGPALDSPCEKAKRPADGPLDGPPAGKKRAVMKDADVLWLLDELKSLLVDAVRACAAFSSSLQHLSAPPLEQGEALVFEQQLQEAVIARGSVLLALSALVAAPQATAVPADAASLTEVLSALEEGPAVFGRREMKEHVLECWALWRVKQHILQGVDDLPRLTAVIDACFPPPVESSDSKKAALETGHHPGSLILRSVCFMLLKEAVVASLSDEPLDPTRIRATIKRQSPRYFSLAAPGWEDVKQSLLDWAGRGEEAAEKAKPVLEGVRGNLASQTTEAEVDAV